MQSASSILAAASSSMMQSVRRGVDHACDVAGSLHEQARVYSSVRRRSGRLSEEGGRVERGGGGGGGGQRGSAERHPGRGERGRVEDGRRGSQLQRVRSSRLGNRACGEGGSGPTSAWGALLWLLCAAGATAAAAVVGCGLRRVCLIAARSCSCVSSSSFPVIVGQAAHGKRRKEGGRGKFEISSRAQGERETTRARGRVREGLGACWSVHTQSMHGSVRATHERRSE